MLSADVIKQEMLDKVFEHTDKFLFLIDKDTKILDFNDSFNIYKDKFAYLKDLITYTHIGDFMDHINTLYSTKDTLKFLSNFSFDKYDVEDIPSTYEIVMSLRDDNIIIAAEPKASLSHDDAKLYLSLVNDYSKNSRELIKTKHELERLNNNLNEEVHRIVDELRKKDEILFKQSKDAAMGEMIDAIAHQWKGPLSTIRILGQSIEMDYEMFGAEHMDNILKNASYIQQNVDHLVETLDEFRSFFRPKSTFEEVSISTILDSVHMIMKDDIIKHNISIEKTGDLDLKINIIPNEFKHVLINLLSNSKDAFVLNDIKDRVIKYDISKVRDGSVTIKFIDNAGGIKQEIIDRVFDANFTTKEEGKGTGIGLYMTKRIIEKIGASIKVENCEGGVCFTMTF